MAISPWEDWEIEWLIRNYPDMGKKASCIYLNRTEASIRQKTSRLKLRQNRNSPFFKDWQARAANSKIGKKRPAQSEVLRKTHREGKLIKNDCQKAAASQRMKEWISVNGHPRGMLGKNHSKETLVVLSESLRNRWSIPDSTYNQDWFRQILSDRMMHNMNNKKLSPGYSRGKSGKRKDLNDLYVRSSWEANYARYLNFLIKHKIIFKWEYEPDVFMFEKIKRGTRSYTPDFKIWELHDSVPYYVEIKGWMDAKSKTKLKRIAKYYPDVRIVLVGKDEYKKIEKSFSGIVENWE